MNKLPVVFLASSLDVKINTVHDSTRKTLFKVLKLLEPDPANSLLFINSKANLIFDKINKVWSFFLWSRVGLSQFATYFSLFIERTVNVELMNIFIRKSVFTN